MVSQDRRQVALGGGFRSLSGLTVHTKSDPERSPLVSMASAAWSQFSDSGRHDDYGDGEGCLRFHSRIAFLEAASVRVWTPYGC